jgi:subtilisin family serine protease
MVRAVMASRNLKVDIINMSYGEPSSRPNVGRVLDIMNELVFKHNVLFVASAGNSGPCLTTTGAPGGLATGLIGVGAVVTSDMAQVQYTIREHVDEKQYTWSSRGPAFVSTTLPFSLWGQPCLYFSLSSVLTVDSVYGFLLPAEPLPPSLTGPSRRTNS